MNFKQWLEAAENVNSIVQEFYTQMQQNHPGLNLGTVGSGNCAWTAKAFQEWATQNGKGNAQVLFFLWSERESSAHIVPATRKI